MVGRNEHCPCGSGKKYKKCCGANEAVSIFQVLENEIDDLQKRILYFALNHYEDEIQEAFEEFQEVFPFKDNEEQQFYEFVFTIWFSLFMVLEDGDRIIDKFIRTEAGKLKRQKTKQILQSWVNPRAIAGEVERIEANKVMAVDGFTSEKLETIVINSDRSFEKGTFFIGILLPFEQMHVFFPAPFDLEDLPSSVAFDFIKQKSLRAGYQSPQAFLTDFFMEIMKDLPQIGRQVDVDSFEWESPVYKEVAEIFQSNLEELEESPTTVDLGIILWITYCQKKQKRIKNPNLYAAALHYLVSTIDYMEVPLTQKEIANLYGVPAGSVSSFYRETDAVLEEDIIQLLEQS